MITKYTIWSLVGSLVLIAINYFLWKITEDVFYIALMSGVIGFIAGYSCLMFEIWGTNTLKIYEVEE